MLNYEITDVCISLFQLFSLSSPLNCKAYIKLMQEIEGLKVSQLQKNLKIENMEHELV